MKKLELRVDTDENIIRVVSDVQEKLEAQEALKVENVGEVEFNLTFDPCHPFSFPKTNLSLPAGKNVEFQIGSEVHYLLRPELKPNIRPRTRSVIVTVLQPGDGPLEHGRKSQSVAIIEVRRVEKTLVLFPQTTTVTFGQTVRFLNATPGDIEVVFQPVTPFTEKSLDFELVKGKPLDLKLDNPLPFSFVVQPEKDPGNQVVKGDLLVSI